ncbi:hypothetical protein [Polyangium spumosum]|uniref:Uncharacterized protein n=1 Tax=Polyangium spumosum TaxID=889282 RepID=A0A6N7PJI4_9BACT|nr:hypothetical protein [Polyangium spumosum]MRG90315.1 hypothetical protein [Polyangium spumosum]
MKVGEDDGDEGPGCKRDPVLEAVERAPLVPATDEEIELLEEGEDGPATWKRILKASDNRANVESERGGRGLE